MNRFQKFHLGENAKIVTEQVPGIESLRLLELQKKIEGSIVSYPRGLPIAIKRAKGAIIEDADGNMFIDFFAGAGVLNLGHCNSYVLDYVKEQQEQLIHMLDFPTENKLDLIKKILDQLPEEIRDQYKVNFCGPTGSDAVEAAIKLAKHKTGRSTIIAFQGSYHGMTSGALGLTSNVKFREKINSLIPNVHFLPYSYCYRCAFKQTPDSCQLECADYLKEMLENSHSGIPKPAAILLEPIQGEGGTIIPRDGYLKRIMEIATKHEIPVIFDEIQCGFFRTGKFVESLNINVFPDIFTMSKGLGGVGFPISAIIYNKKVEAWGPGDHIGTFRGNQVSIAAGRGAMDFVKEYNLEGYISAVSLYLLDQLNMVTEYNPFVGEIRARGLFIGIEYVKDKLTKEPFPQAVKELRKLCFQKGLLFEVGGHYDNVIRILPPLIITKEIIDNAISIFDEANKELLVTHQDLLKELSF